MNLLAESSIDWTTIIVASIPFLGSALVAYLKHRGKTKLAAALQVVVDAVEEQKGSSGQEVKDTVSMNTRELPDLKHIIDKAKREAEVKAIKSGSV